MSLVVGFTFDLREDHLRLGASSEDVAEFDIAATIDAIDGALSALDCRVERIGHLKNLVAALARGRRWDLVFNFAEGSRGFGRESQVPALLDAYDIPYTFSDALTNALTLHKAMAKYVLRGLGLPTPDFRVVSSPEEAERVSLSFPLFVKPANAGSSVGVTKVTSAAAIRNALETAFAYDTKVLVEAGIDAREIECAVLGNDDPQASIPGEIVVTQMQPAGRQRAV